MNHFSYFSRSHHIKKMKAEHFDLVIVGGGINGAGVARDAASRGMKVAVVEARDFAFGTSSRSSKLIHGGIRYLENLEFGLVFEALSERKLLFQIAPHMVHPLKFNLPVYKGSRVGINIMSLGMWLYDALALFEAPESHERLSPQDVAERLPLLQTNNLEGAFAYYDAYMDDDRLVHETLRSACEHGAAAANYLSCIKAEFNNGQLQQMICRDLLTNDEFTIRGHHFIGATGPWTDIFGHKVMPSWKNQLRPTKGIHLTIDRNRLPLKDAIVMVDDIKKRIVFGIPRHEMIIIGTTDTDFKDDPESVHSTQADVEYLFEVVEEYFPNANLTKDDIISSYAGVRPLVHDGSDSEGKTSREHKIWDDGRNITFVAGGKYTTYRHMSEQVVNHALEFFSVEKQMQFAKSDTKKALNPLVTPESLARARGCIKDWSLQFGFSESDISFLVERHGFEALSLLHRSKQDKLNTIWEIEAWHAIHNSMCGHLDDFYIRRAPMFLALPDHGYSQLDSVSQVFARYLGWDKSQIEAEIQKLKAHENRELAWKNQL